MISAAEEQEEAQKRLLSAHGAEYRRSNRARRSNRQGGTAHSDANCNGDMHDALNYAANIKHKQKDFLTKQGIHALYD